jgi:hypothetical protein
MLSLGDIIYSPNFVQNLKLGEIFFNKQRLQLDTSVVTLPILRAIPNF